MAFNVRHPVWLPAAPTPGIKVFVVLYFVEALARSAVSTVIPIQAYELLQDKQAVSFVYTAIGLFVLVFSFLLPVFIRLLTRKWIYTIGACFLMVSGVCLMLHDLPGQIAGMLGRTLGAACLNVTLNLYIMDNIKKDSFVKLDSTRMTLSMLAWSGMPFLGVWTYTHVSTIAPYALSFGCAIVLVAIFWYMRLKENGGIAPAKRPPANPLRFVPRFVAQPRLRLAWVIAFGRTATWATFFVYGPIYMLVTGQGNEAGGILIMLGNAMMATSMFWGKAASRFGIRRIAGVSYLGAAASFLVVAFMGEAHPLMAGAFMIIGILFAVPLDVVGGVPFYRSVHPHERVEMTAVFRTYMDFAELLPPLVYGVLLGFFGLGSVFAALCVLQVFCGFLCFKFLPRRL